MQQRTIHEARHYHVCFNHRIMYRPKYLGGTAWPTCARMCSPSIAAQSFNVSEFKAKVLYVYFWLLALLISFVSPVYGQQEQDTKQLPAVVVEDAPLSPELLPDRSLNEKDAREKIERTPGGVGLVDQQEIEESRAFNLKDVLDFVPGVFIRPRFGAEESQISIRGSGLRNNFHLRGVDIVIDGFSVNNADGFGVFGRRKAYRGVQGRKLSACRVKSTRRSNQRCNQHWI